MKSVRTNLTLFVIATLLTPLTWWTWQQNSKTFTDYSDIPRLFDGFREDSVVRAVISEPDLAAAGPGAAEGAPRRDLVLQRSNDGWLIANTALQGADARPEEVRRAILVHLGAIRRDDKAIVVPLASDEQLAEFALDEASATRVQAFDGVDGRAPIVDLYVGRATNAAGIGGEDLPRGYFVRRADERDVVFYETPSWVVTSDPNQFADRRVLEFKVSDAVRLELKNRTGLVQLERPDADVGSWTVIVGSDGQPLAPAGVGPVRQPIVTELLNQLARMTVAKFIEPLEPSRRAECGLTDSLIAARVTLADETRVMLLVGSKVPGANEHYAETSSSKLLLTVGDWVVDSLSRDVHEIFDPGDAGPSGGASDRPGTPNDAGNETNTGNGNEAGENRGTENGNAGAAQGGGQPDPSPPDPGGGGTAETDNTGASGAGRAGSSGQPPEPAPPPTSRPGTEPPPAGNAGGGG